MSDTLTPKQKIAASRIIVQKKACYFSAALRALIPYEAPGLGTMGVTDRGVMMYDPVKVMEWSVDELAAVLVHELNHVIRNHAARAKRMKIPPNQFLLWNIATDAEINDDLVCGGWKLPEEPVLPWKIECRDGLTAEQYFRALLEQAENESQGQPGQPGDGEGQPGQSGGGEGQPGQPGQSGQESSRDHSEGGSADSCPKESQLKPKTQVPMDLPRCGSGAGYELPDEPKDIQGKSKAEMERMRNVVAEEIRKEGGRSRGSIPGGLRRWADERLKPPEVPWQQKLGVLARRAVTYKAGVVDYRYDRPSRRQSAFGFGDGRIILPRMRAPVPNVTIAIDTSASMGTEELTTALREAQGILNATGAAVEILAADTEVTDIKKVQRVEEARKMLTGGGGTDFRPVFEMLQKRSVGRPDVVVYMTDGYGPAPMRPPSDMTVIWLLMGRWGHQKPCKWGEAIEVKAA